MSQSMIEHYRKKCKRMKCKRMGRWMAPRYLRNRGVSFGNAYFILFDRVPPIL